jgi:hypothetical protein
MAVHKHVLVYNFKQCRKDYDLQNLYKIALNDFQHGWYTYIRDFSSKKGITIH